MIYKYPFIIMARLNFKSNSIMYSKLLSYTFLFLFATASLSQTYFTTGGIRLGSDYGLSLKQRILKKTTIEAILNSQGDINSNLGLSLIYAKHKGILTRNFNFFYGAGITFRWDQEQDPELGWLKHTSYGIPIQAGIELTVGRINLSWDYTPILYISSYSNAFTSSKGLSVRYTFVTKKEGKRFIKKIKSPFKTKRK